MRTASLVLIGAVALGFVLRLLPWLLDPAIALRDDAAFHERIVEETVATGHVPAVDVLSEAPQGRRLHEQLPIGMYATAAAFHRALVPLDRAPVRTHLIVFIALAGALIAVPVFLATHALGGGLGAAALAALIAVTLPAHLHRTFGYWVRYDAPGVLLISLHIAFLLRALRPTSATVRSRIDAVLALGFLIAAAEVWRVSLLFPPLEAAWVLAAIAVRGVERPVRDWMLLLAVGGTLAFATLDPMRSQHVTRSGAWLLVLAAAAASALPSARPGSRAARVATALIAVAVAFVAAATAGNGAYAGTLELVALKLRQTVLGGAATNPLSRLSLDVIELYGLSPLALAIGPQQFLALGPWFLAAPVILARLGGWHPRDAFRTFVTPGGLLVFVCVVLTALTLLFSRNKVLLAPWVAVVCALVGQAVWRANGAAPVAPRARQARGRGTSERAPRNSVSPGRVVARAAFALSVVATAVCGVLLAQSRRSNDDHDLAQALTFLRERTPRAAAVAAPWWYGYDIQALADRPTVTDGLLESRENQRRILDLYAAFLSGDADHLASLCRRYGAAYVLVPPPDEITNVAWVTEPALSQHITEGRSATPEDLRRTLVRLMRREPVPGFEPVFENQRFRVVRLTSRPLPPG